jgi:hypothetical protein
MFGPKMDEMVGVWRKLCNEELHNLYSLPNIIRVIKPWKMILAGQVACFEMGKTRRKENTREA